MKRYRVFLMILCLCVIIPTLNSCALFRKTQSYCKFENRPDFGGYALSGVDESYNRKKFEVPEFDSLGNKVVGVWHGAIATNDEIEEVIIGDHIEWLSPAALFDLPNLKKVYIGKGVSRIERGLFEKCPNLETVVIDPQNPYFKSEGGLILTKDGKTLVRGWGKVDKIPDSVETIQYLAFFQNQHLEALEIPESVKEIEWEAFYDCNNLKTVSIPASVSVIGQCAFYRCENVTVYLKMPSAKPTFDKDWNLLDYNSKTDILSYVTVVFQPDEGDAR